jgi:hypothetical protein
MLRAFLILSTLPTVVGVLLFSLYTLKPYDNRALLPLLDTGECAAPCWNGIEPGVTTIEQARMLLEADPQVHATFRAVYHLDWQWNGTQPAIFAASNPFFQGRLMQTTVNGVEVVDHIAILTNATFGDMQLALGDPDVFTVLAHNPDGVRSAFVVMLSYTERDLHAFGFVNCPLNPTDFWQTQVTVAYGEPEMPYYAVYAGDQMPDWFYREGAPGCNG